MDKMNDSFSDKFLDFCYEVLAFNTCNSEIGKTQIRKQIELCRKYGISFRAFSQVLLEYKSFIDELGDGDD